MFIEEDRTHGGEEIDLVLEDAAGRLVGIEVKASETVRGEDFKAQRSMAEAAGRRFRRGVVLHARGTDRLSSGRPPEG